MTAEGTGVFKGGAASAQSQGAAGRLQVASVARLRFDKSDGTHVLLSPERGLSLNETATFVVQLCDGSRNAEAVVSSCIARFGDAPPERIEADVRALLAELLARGLVVEQGDPAEEASESGGFRRDPATAGRDARSVLVDGSTPDGAAAPESPKTTRPLVEPRPYTLVAELTYKCPLRCGYCSNPVDLAAHANELGGDEWARVFTEAEALGIMGVNLTGGEPLLRKDLETLVRHARSLGLYTNLITSGLPLARERLLALREAGLDHVQLSVQDSEKEGCDRIAGTRAFEAKLAVAGWVKDLGMALTVNAVLHADNVDRTAELIALAERLGADRLELAHTQYLGWALENRARLLPTAAQIEASRAVAHAARARLRGRMDVSIVLPDYVAGRPRPCMEGWGRRFLVVSPDGLILPCHAAHTLPGLAFESVRDRTLADVWRESPAFERFRGEDWMADPCKTCDRRAVDYGGCRCQAFHLTGDPARTDPACGLSPDHGIVARAVARADSGDARPEMVFRGSRPRRLPVMRGVF